LLGNRIGVSLAVVGALVAAVTAATGSLVVAVAASAVLGASYGILMVSGLVEVQRIAAPEHLAGLTAVYYSLTYLGFLWPVVLAPVAGVLPYATLLPVVAAIAAVCLLVLVLGGRGRVAG
jgi:hypothetical protein